MKSFCIIPFLLLACNAETRPYYDSENAVSVAGLDVQSEMGNMGGGELNISGSGFGTELNGVTVMFGNQNAEVLEVSDSLIKVKTPRGPVKGGFVDVRVGNASGQSSLEDGYQYKIPGNGIDDTESSTIAYLSVSNDALSCYGGVHNNLIGGCDTFAYIGLMGVTGRAEGLEFIYPKAHSPYFGGKGGFASMTDISWEKWFVTNDPKDMISIDDEGSVDGLRLDLGEVKLINPALEGSWCPDLPSQASFVYDGIDELYLAESQSGGLGQPQQGEEEPMGIYIPNASVAPLGDLNTSYYNEQNKCINSKEYLVGEMEFCMETEYEEGRSFVFEPDWPVYPNFFRGDLEGTLSDTAAIDIQLAVSNVDFASQSENTTTDITLPPYAIFNDVTGRGETWSVGNLTSTCPQDDGSDDTADYENAAMTWEWEPVEWDVGCDGNGLCPGSDVTAVNSYIKVSMSHFNIGWYGGEGSPMKATITVPDKYNYDEAENKSSLSIPSWVLYSFPSTGDSYGYTNSGLGGEIWGGYGDPNRYSYGFIIITIDRVTEYTIPSTVNANIAGSAETVNGDFVFAYSTGDMGFFQFDNPLDSESTCNDCLDNDGDGWTDDKDPDCADGDSETEVTTNNTCNNGIDDDGDGLVDSDDDNCETGLSAESAECSDGIDNDEDGWADANDPDCVAGIFEDNATFGESSCNDGIDNDNDGYIDSKDLGCTEASLAEDDGYFDGDGDGVPDFECNNGIDDDGHGDIDADDYRCATRGADETETTSFVSICNDGLDNDEDGYIDGNDPDCERTVTREEDLFYEADMAWTPSGVPECYNGADDDGDGAIDALDLDCVNDAGEADGFIMSEGE